MVKKIEGRVLKIGIAGLGTVGMGVVDGILRNRQTLKHRTGCDICLAGICTRSTKNSGNINLQNYPQFTDAVELAKAPNIDVFIETIGGGDGVALKASVAALQSGKTLITANKAMLSIHGEFLAKLAEENGTQLYFEAAIAGGIPIVKTLRESLVGNTIKKVYGILNGTCNYIFTNLKSTKKTFDAVLADAQDLGYAERDPGFDIDGIDAGQKIALLASLAFGTRICFDEAHIKGMRHAISRYDIEMADSLGLTPKFVSMCEKHEDSLFLYTMPVFVEKTSILATVDGVVNGCIVEGDMIGRLILIGAGAGRNATASAVLSDIADVASNRQAFSFNRPVKTLDRIKIAPISSRYNRFYIRSTEDVAVLQSKLHKNNIAVDQYLGAKDIDGGSVAVVEWTQESILQDAVGDIAEACIRIEKC